MNAETRTYRSIFLDTGWAHQKYFGWRLAADRPGLRVLKKRRLVFDRYLMLLTAEGEPWLEHEVARAVGRFGMSDVVVKDFDGALPAPPCLAGHVFQLAESRERLLNVATFVIDLKQDESDILAAMSADYRRKIKKAEASGLTVEAHSRPSPQLLNGFLEALSGFAGAHKLAVAPSAAIEAMYAGDDAVLFVARRAKDVTNYLHVYKAGDTSLFMYSVNISKANDGAGQYLHWQALRHLKAEGFGWYDLGGFAKLDASDGIYNFKEKFGGRQERLGLEWRWAGQALRSAKSVAAAMRRGATG